MILLGCSARRSALRPTSHSRFRMFRTTGPCLTVCVVLSLILTACASGIDSAVFLEAPPRAVDATVAIYSTQTPSCSYDELGIVTWRPPGGQDRLQVGVERMRRRARQMGGDAILDFRIVERDGANVSTVSSDSTGVAVRSWTTTAVRASGTVVRFRDPTCRPDSIG